MSKGSELEVPGDARPSLEVSDAGIYVRFQMGVRAEKTLLRSEWPHLAVDLASNGTVVGIECVPVPEKFTIGQLAKQAGVFVPPSVLQYEPQIQTKATA